MENIKIDEKAVKYLKDKGHDAITIKLERFGG
jgi:hypothetical protein